MKNELPTTTHAAATAYKDDCLENRPGELWKEIPGLHGDFLVSNFGRIKRVERQVVDSQGGIYKLPARIRKAQVNKDRNMRCHDWTYRLQVVLQVRNVKYSFQVARLVYHCFVEPFNLKDTTVNVTTRNGNGLDVRPENLILVSLREKAQRPYDTGRQLSHLQTDKYKLLEIVKASREKTSLMISQYDSKGLWLKTYPSIMEAYRNTGISYGNISKAVKRPASKAGGFYWRYGDGNKINLKEVHDHEKRRQRSYKEKQGRKVTQYDMEGNPVAWYSALSEAARKAKVSHKSITTHLKGLTRHAGGFLWKLGHHTDKFLLHAVISRAVGEGNLLRANG
ncbi:hypothetical protein HNQ91_000793 [Filimonas zeae]|uniref:NUMOD1 domain-containing protein n=1 Tax=Filimonas zeae TaxID=1737353 RepID=A0A917IS90_9BACT|nr:NUMOD1 domain-containing DNA-binding protein [Filimonas zeae]MDR6337771.1 hypothetical protein [Filimonas zeae]GGH60181.1 hypothetical protein GCM10011379_07760 [Filimonas zeae]